MKRIFKQRPKGRKNSPQVVDEPRPATAATILPDDLLDEIDQLLEVNAEQLLRGFVQKSGQ